MKPFYVTFNDSPVSPYGLGEFVIVYGNDINDASENYRKVHPNIEKDHYNFAFIYNENSWKQNVSQFYSTKEPSEIIGEKEAEQEADDKPREIYLVENQSGVCGYITSEEIANDLVSLLREKDTDSNFSIYSCLTSISKPASKNLVANFSNENKPSNEMQDEMER